MQVVSLVPSASETLVGLGTPPVACTRFCLQPGIPTVGGTKTPDIEAVVDLAPDLVVVNDEENRLEDADALVAAGLSVHSMSPRSVSSVGAEVRRLARAVGAPTPGGFEWEDWTGWLEGWGARAPSSQRAFVAIWRRPWMTLSAETYGASVLDLLGIETLFANSRVRYPEVTLDDVRAEGPDLVLLPTEPYRFRDRHVEEVRAALPASRVVIVDGQDLFWWGIRTRDAVERLAGTLLGR